jgi:iron(II)-dependent oxidoreductase
VPDRYFHELALYHEDMHGEALLMTLQTLALPAPPWWRSPAVATAAASVDVAFEGGSCTIGSSSMDARSRFVFDNEQWSHEVTLAPFAIASRPVTQGEFAAFVDAGGYVRDAFWPVAARAWRDRAGRTLPAHWRRESGGFASRGFDAWQPIDPHAPMCHVSAYEAEAWCNWAGRRLPTEAEWEHAAVAGALAVPCAVWEWTATPFEPYPGFAPGPYAEYSAPWFGDHRVMRGGSWATRARLVHPRWRNFYTPDRHDAFVGFRTCAAR